MLNLTTPCLDLSLQSLQASRYGEEPSEDAEMAGFATQFVESLAENFVIPEVQGNLCDLCANIPVQWLLITPRNTYVVAGYDDMQESAKSCGLCKLILSCVNPEPDWTPLKIQIYLSPQILTVSVRVGSEGADTGGYTRHLRVCTDSGKGKLLA